MQFCPFFSLFRHFFGCHGHKYAYYRDRSHRHLPWIYTKMVCSSFGHCHALVMNTGASKMDQNQVTMAGSVWGRNSSRKFFSTWNHINANRKTWFRAVLTPAIPSLNRFCRYCSRKKFPWKIFRPLKIFKLLQAQF